MIRIISNKSFVNNDVDEVVIESGDRLIVDKDLMTKLKNLDFRFKFFNHLRNMRLYVTRIIEISLKDEYITKDEFEAEIITDYSYYDTVHKELGKHLLPKYAIIFEVNTVAVTNIEYFSEYRSGKQKDVTLKSIDNSYEQLTTDIIANGIDHVYAKSCVPEGCVPLKQIATVDAGKVLSFVENKGKPNEHETLPYISAVHTKFPVITNECGLTNIRDYRQTTLHNGAIILLAQARLKSDLFKPILVPKSMRVFISNKLFYLNLINEDIEYSQLLCEYFSNNEELLAQFPRANFSVPINQFRSIFVPTKEHLLKLYNMPADKYSRLEFFSEKLAKATAAVAEAEEEICKLQNRVYKKEIIE